MMEAVIKMKNELKAGFIDSIKRQIELYKKLKGLIADENKILLGKNIRGMEEIAKKEENIVTEIRKTEEEKRSLLRQIAEDLKLNDGNTSNLVDVLAGMGKRDAKEIENTVVELINIVKEVDATNRSNIHMIKNYLEYTDFMRKIRERSQQAIQTTYDENGYKQTIQMERKSTVDRTI